MTEQIELFKPAEQPAARPTPVVTGDVVYWWEYRDGVKIVFKGTPNNCCKGAPCWSAYIVEKWALDGRELDGYDIGWNRNFFPARSITPRVVQRLIGFLKRRKEIENDDKTS